jgi:hypothetical protein
MVSSKLEQTKKELLLFEEVKDDFIKIILRIMYAEGDTSCPGLE